ncbi:MAG: flippase [Candidatus Pacebacteria bacterium]|nr:flippase [Candidatus Paceibacterota bacterium]
MKLNLTQKIAYNALFSAGARVIEVALALVIIGLTTRYLGDGGFGDYIIVITFVYIFSVIADLGLYSIVVREISRKGADEEKIVNNAFTLRFVAGFFILGSAFFVSLIFPYSGSVKHGIAIAALGFWILSNIQVLMGLFQKQLAMDKVAIAEILGRIIQLLFVLICVELDLGFLYIIFSIFLGAIFSFVLVLFFTSKYIKIRLRFDFRFWIVLLKQAYPLAVSAILVLIYFKLDTIFLSVMKSREAVGVYGLSYKILENLIFFPAMIVGLTMPIMSRYIFTDRDRFKSVVQRTLNFLLIAVVPMMFGTVLISDKIIKLIGGEIGFVDSPLVLNILMIALGFIFLGALFSNIIIAANKQKALAQIYFVGMIFNIITNFIFIPRYSYFGAAATTVATELLVTILMIFVVYKSVKFIPSFAVLFKAFFASSLMAFALYHFNYLNIFYLIIFGAVVYLSTIYFIGGVSKEEIEKLVGKKDY